MEKAIAVPNKRVNVSFEVHSSFCHLRFHAILLFHRTTSCSISSRILLKCGTRGASFRLRRLVPLRTLTQVLSRSLLGPFKVFSNRFESAHVAASPPLVRVRTLPSGSRPAAVV